MGYFKIANRPAFMLVCDFCHKQRLIDFKTDKVAEGDVVKVERDVGNEGWTNKNELMVTTACPACAEAHEPAIRWEFPLHQAEIARQLKSKKGVKIASDDPAFDPETLTKLFEELTLMKADLTASAGAVSKAAAEINLQIQALQTLSRKVQPITPTGPFTQPSGSAQPWPLSYGTGRKTSFSPGDFSDEPPEVKPRLEPGVYHRNPDGSLGERVGAPEAESKQDEPVVDEPSVNPARTLYVNKDPRRSQAPCYIELDDNGFTYKVFELDGKLRSTIDKSQLNKRLKQLSQAPEAGQ